MKFLRLPVMAITALSVSFSVKAQSVDEIVGKHVQAIGGKEKLNGMKTLYTEADLEIQGNQGTSATSVIFGKGSYAEMELGGQKIINCVTADKGGWSINPFAGQESATDMPEGQVNIGKAQLSPGGSLVDYAAKGNKVELAGQEELNGAKVYKLNVTTKEGSKLIVYLDASTYYIVKSTVKVEANGQEMEQSVNFSDFKKTDYGYVAPYTSVIELPGGMAINIVVRKIEINKDIDPKIFAKP